MNKKSQTSSGESHAVAIGAGVMAVAAAAAGAYYLFGTDKGAKKRKVMKSWMLKMKADVMDEVEQLKDLNEDLYHAAVAKVAEKYKMVKNVDPAEVMVLAQRMQKHWKDIKRDVQSSAKKVGIGAKKGSRAKKMAKK
jgi:hypothetical protein